MAKDKIGVTLGQYFVEVGKLDSGRQQRFYLGRVSEVSEDEARVRRHRVRQFWLKFREHNPLNAWAVDRWNRIGLDYAKEISKGATRVNYPPESADTKPPQVEDGQSFLKVLSDLNTHYEGAVTFVAAPDHHDAVKGMADHYHGLVAVARSSTPEGTVAHDDAGNRLYDWLERFASYAKTTLTEANDTGEVEATEWSTIFAKHVIGIRKATPDIPLSGLDYPTVERVVIYFANRPISAKTGKPISVKFAKAHIKAWKRFIQWLPKQTKWRKPEDWQDAFNHRPKNSRLEKSEKPIGVVKAYKLPELLTIYRYATPYERCLFLLALNCGFGAIEISQLRNREVVTDEAGQGYIKRVRTKNTVGVYGEHLLWPATMEACRWSLKRSQSIVGGELGPNALVVLRDSGDTLVKKTAAGRSNKAANAWDRLTKRIQQDEPEFPKLSFGKLRKTAGNLIKRFADGETVAVFHQRSSAVASDYEAEVYTDRMYDRVFKAQQEVHRVLSPLWEAVPEPFPEVRAKNYIGLKAIDDIKRLWAEGVKPEQIAKLTKTSKATVYRHRPPQVAVTADGEEAGR